MVRKGPIIKNKNKNNRHRTNCNDSSRVIVGRSPNDSIYYSWSVQKSVEHYIKQYDLKCSLLQFPIRVPWVKLLTNNKISNEFLDVFSNNVNWSIACRYQKLSKNLMEKYAKLLDWNMVSLYQKLSKRFIIKHCEDLNMDVIMNQRFLISSEEIDNLKEKEKEKEEFLRGGEEIKNRFDILDM